MTAIGTGPIFPPQPPDPRDACPTCGSDDAAVRYVIAPLGNGGERECDDSWHDDSCESENRV